MKTGQRFWGRSVAVFAGDPMGQSPTNHKTTEFAGDPSVNQVPEPVSQKFENKGDGSDKRRRRRRPIPTSVQVFRDCINAPETAELVDASTDGILFTTDREYRVGMELIARYPFPSATSPKQVGIVVRVEKLPDGHRRVAVRF